MPNKNGKGSDQVNFRMQLELRRLVARLVGAEQMRRPDDRVSRESVLRDAVLEFARRRHPDLVPKEL